MYTPIGAILVFVYLLAAFVAFAAGDLGIIVLWVGLGIAWLIHRLRD